MSKRHTTSRKSTSKVSAVSVNDNKERQMTRKSTRVSRRPSIADSPIKSPIHSTLQSPISSKGLPNLSQYFPSRKRSQSSPRNQSPLDQKYTRLKSPNLRFRKRILADNPITYGEFENSFDDNSSQELCETPRKEKHKPIVKKRVSNKTEDKVTIDFKGLLTSFQSVMDEVVDEDMELTAADSVDERLRSSEQQNDGVENLAQMISDLATEQPQEADNHYYLIPCHSRDLSLNHKSSIKDKQKSGTKVQQVFKEVNKTKVESISCESKAKQNQSNSFDDDFDDDLDDLLCDITFPIEDCGKNVDNNIHNNEVKDNGVDSNRIEAKQDEEEDDGFESDGDFERIMSQIPNEELANPLDRSDSTLDTSIRNMSSSSLASSGLITLSQIIELINKD